MKSEADALCVEQLRVSYGAQEVLHGLDLRLKAGEIFGLLGPNGAGKTTLVRTICGRIKPDQGRLLVAGSPISRKSRRRIGLVPQEIALYPHLTIRENLSLFGRLSGLAKHDLPKAVEWAAKAGNLLLRIDQRIETLSGGWRRRANIAAAILHRPALLILDEPTVGVDVEARNDLHDVIQHLSGSGLGVLLATHDLDQAETLCTKVGFLRHGVIAPQGNPQCLVQDAFGNHTEIIVELRRPPEPSGAERLRSSHFTSSSGALVWSRISAVEAPRPEQLTEHLEAFGLSVREIRFREPGLDTLFLHLARRGGELPDGAGA